MRAPGGTRTRSDHFRPSKISRNWNLVTCTILPGWSWGRTELDSTWHNPRGKYTTLVALYGNVSRHIHTHTHSRTSTQRRRECGRLFGYSWVGWWDQTDWLRIPQSILEFLLLLLFSFFHGKSLQGLRRSGALREEEKRVCAYYIQSEDEKALCTRCEDDSSVGVLSSFLVDCPLGLLLVLVLEGRERTTKMETIKKWLFFYEVLLVLAQRSPWLCRGPSSPSSPSFSLQEDSVELGENPAQNHHREMKIHRFDQP